MLLDLFEAFEIGKEAYGFINKSMQGDHYDAVDQALNMYDAIDYNSTSCQQELNDIIETLSCVNKDDRAYVRVAAAFIRACCHFDLGNYSKSRQNISECTGIPVDSWTLNKEMIQDFQRKAKELRKLIDQQTNPTPQISASYQSQSYPQNSNDRKRQQKQKQKQLKQKPQQVQNICTNKRYSRSELLRIIAECDGMSPISTSEVTVISSDAEKLRNNLQNRGINISKSQIGKVSTYGGLMNYIESHTDVTGTDTSSSSKEVTNRNSQPQTNTKEDFYLLVKFTSNNPSGGVYCVVQANGSKKFPSHTRVLIKRTTGDVAALCKRATTSDGYSFNGPLLDGKEYRLEINDVSRDDIPAGAKIYICPMSVDKSEYMDTYGAGYTNGDNVGLLLEGVSAEQVKSGMIATAVKPEMSGNLSTDINTVNNDKGQENLKNNAQVQTPDQSCPPTEEQEYLDELKECLADGEIGPRERRLLDKLASKLGISPERAAELEASLSKPSLTAEEKEYLEEVQAVLADGEISDKERRLLDKLRKMLNLSEERAKELENLATS